MNGWTFGSALRGSTSARALVIALAPFAMAFPLSAAVAGPALPTGGQYVAGSGTIAKKTSGLTVTQSSNTGIIDWSSFSVGKGSGVQFNNGTGATLNRVTGGNLSTIAGSLKATGSLYLINPQGVIVSGSGRVITGGTFAASSRDTADSDFMGGKKLRFSGSSTGNVSNAGRITAGGDVLLIGNAVSNSGTVTAANGTASLNAANNVYLAPAGGNGRLLVMGGKGSVTNSGTISAAQAQLNAAGGNVYALSGNNGGIIRATGTQTIGGHVWLTSNTGNVSISGNVRATNADGSGGTISAKAGNIALGGTLNVSATQSTKAGGKVSVVAKKTTTLTGSIRAQGGSHGKGGFIETSGAHVHVAGGARINTLAPSGKSGTWLIDPNDYTIAASGGDITGATLSTNLATTDVAISSNDGATSGNGDIIVNDAVSWSSTHSLTLTAVRDIDVHAKITVSGGEGVLSLTAARDLNFNSGRVAFGGYANDSTGALSIDGTGYTLENSVAALANAIDNNDAAGHYALADDYDASADGTYTAAPITATFSGSFEGLGNTISNLSITDATHANSDGLFSVISGSVSDLALADVTVISVGSNMYAGGLAGFLAAGAGITNVSVSGSISGVGAIDTVGGVAGRSNQATLTNSSSSASISGGTGDGSAGGFVGLANGGTFVNDSATGAVAGNDGADAIGGFAAEAGNGATITGSAASGAVTSAGNGSYAGGFVGQIFGSGATIQTSHATGTVSVGNNVSDVGGFAGAAGGSGTIIETSYATGAVDGSPNSVLGGFAGYVDTDATIANSYATGSVTGGGYEAGGFVGLNAGAISFSYATGTVTGGSAAGGFVGRNLSTGTIDQSYSSGPVTSSGTVGGFSGENDNTSGLSASVADYFNSTANTGAGVGSDAASSNVHGITAANMFKTSSFTGWTFGTTGGASGWVIADADATLNNAGSAAGATTPMLLKEYSTTITSAHQLQLMALDRTANYTLNNDIDATSTGTGKDVWGAGGFAAVGGNVLNLSFQGDLDGNAHVIDGLTVKNTTQSQAGLFGEFGGTVEDLGLTHVDIETSKGVAVGGQQPGLGALAGSSFGTITNVYATGSVTSLHTDGNNTAAGGLVGFFNFGSISNSHSAVNVTAGDGSGIGGIAGEDYNGGTIDNSYATGIVTGGNNAISGGLVGLIVFSGTITNSYATGAVRAGNSGDAGGFIGEAIAGTMSNDYATGQVTGNGNGVYGGFVGTNQGSITQSYATGAVTKNVDGSHTGGDFGGFAGGVDGTGTISLSYSTGNVSAGTTATAGGFVGSNGGTIEESYSMGLVTSGAAGLTGGFAGDNVDITHTGVIGDTTEVFYNNTGSNALLPDVGSNTGGTVTIGGLTDMTDHTSYTGWTFGGVGSGADWVVVDTDGTLNNAAGADGGTAPMLLGEYSTTVTNAHQLQLMALDPTANYTLANDIDASRTTGGDVWSDSGFVAIGGNGAANFTGTFNGKGHTIDGLFIDEETNGFVGLFGVIGAAGTVENIALTGVSVTGGNNKDIGALAGKNLGTVSTSSSDGSVTGGNNFSWIGGLVGQNDGLISLSHTGGTVDGGESDVAGLAGESTGTIEQSYSTATITGGTDSDAGGLVGFNGGSILQSYASGIVAGGDQAWVGGLVSHNAAGGSITQSYATGAVTGGNSTDVGGLVGENDNTISQSYSLGVVTGGTSSDIGGFVGDDESSGGITFAYWDTQTSGIGATHGAGNVTSDSGVTGQTTAQLQAGLPSGFDSSVWGHVANSFPYLKWQFASGVTPTVISGTVYSNLTGTNVSAGEQVTVVSGGNVLGTANTFADGTYYVLSGSVNPSTGVAALGEGVSFEDTGVTTGLNIYDFNTAIHATTSDATLSALGINFGAALGTVFGPAVSTVGDILNSFGGDLTLVAAGEFTLDQDLDVGVNTLTLSDSSGSVNGANVILASKLLLTGSANYTLTNSGNQIGTLAANGSLSMDVASDVLTVGTVNGIAGISAGGGVGLESLSGNIVLSRNVTAAGHPVTLTSAGTISETGGARISATSLTGSSHGAVTLNGANVITNLGAFSTGGNFAFALTNAHDLTVIGAVNTGTSGLTLTTTGAGNDILLHSTLHGGTVNLASAATIAANSSGQITAATLTGTSHGAVTLNAANVITGLGAFTTGGNNAFAVTDAHDLTVSGAVTSGTADLTLTTTGAGDDIVLHNTLHGGTVKLASAATISANSAGKITAATLTGAAHGAVSLAAANTITNLGAFSTGGNNAFALTDGHDLTVTGAVNAGTAGLTLTTTGAGDDILFDSTLHGGIVKLASAGKITANANGKITATSLIGSSHGAVSLAAANAITNLGAFTTGGNNAFAFTDAADLAITGAVNAGTGALTLKTTGAGHDLAIKNVLTGGTAALTSAGTLAESGSGVIHATTLTGSSVGGASMNGTNLIATLGNFANTGAGNFSLKDGQALTASGAVSVASATGILALTTTVGNLTINGSLTGPTITLITAGKALEGSAGAITATTLLNVTANTGINLNSTHNHIHAVGTRHTNSGSNVINGVGP